MSPTDRKPPSSPQPSAREARLAQALRANLRRRKQASSPDPGDQSLETSALGDPSKEQG